MIATKADFFEKKICFSKNYIMFSIAKFWEIVREECTLAKVQTKNYNMIYSDTFYIKRGLNSEISLCYG